MILLICAVGVPFIHLLYSAIFDRVMPLNDVLLYGYWLQQMQLGEPIMGIQQDLVYPFPALLPMVLAKLLGGPAGILVGWSTLIGILNAFAIATLTSWGRGSRACFIASWVWLAFLLVLGPVGIGRIDSVAAAIAVFGIVAFAKERIGLATALFSMGAWIKIWPFVLAIATFISDRRQRLVGYAAVATTGAVLVFAAAAGGNASVFSFIFTQGSRGIQIESPVAMFWIWAAKLGAPNTGIYYDKEIITNQVFGSWVGEVSTLMSLIMFIAIAITIWLARAAILSGAQRNELFAVASLTAVLDLIVFNKVGSPQFMAWLIVPVLALILFEVKNLRLIIAVVFAIGALTHLVYPVLYLDLMGLSDLSVITLTFRNALLIYLLVYVNYRLAKLRIK